VRTRLSLVLIVAAFALPGTAAAGGPGDVYNDFVADGVLSCTHSRSDLVAALHSGTLNQYGDPLKLAKMKLAVHKQLAGSCRKRHVASAPAPSPPPPPPPPPAATTSTTTPTVKHRRKPVKHKRVHKAPRGPTGIAAPLETQHVSTQDNSSFLAGRGLALVILAAAVAFGGWLTKHALSARD
jgi:hypothetical protein